MHSARQEINVEKDIVGHRSATLTSVVQVVNLSGSLRRTILAVRQPPFPWPSATDDADCVAQ